MKKTYLRPLTKQVKIECSRVLMGSQVLGGLDDSLDIDYGGVDQNGLDADVKSFGTNYFPSW